MYLVRGGFRDELAVFDEIEDHFRVEEVAAGQAAQVLGEARHLAARGAGTGSGRTGSGRGRRRGRSGRGGGDGGGGGFGQRHVAADGWRVVDPEGRVVHEIPQRRLVAAAGVQPTSIRIVYKDRLQ